jgi:hypothetical protein
VKNISEKSVIYEVQADFPDFKGPKTLRIAADSSSVYKFALNPKKSGSYKGKIFFRNKEDLSYIWYMVKVRCIKNKK